MTQLEVMLNEREATHGSFALNAKISGLLKQVIRRSPGYDALTEVQREALDLMCTKFSRVLSGQTIHKDHWLDVSGYAQLCVREIENWEKEANDLG